MGRHVWLLLMLLGCGRGRFDPRSDGGRDDGSTPCTFTSVAIGEAFTCVVDNRGGVWCWGNNDSGQVVSPPSDSAPGGAHIALAAAAVEVGAGRASACARLVDGTVWCWGENGSGELGNGTTAATNGPTQVSLGGELAVELEVGGRHACARIASDGSIMCWGDNKSFALGNTGPAMVPQVPLAVPGTAGTTQFVLGHRHACGLDATDQVFCWGRGLEGQLGVGAANSAALVRPSGLPQVQTLDASNRVTCVVIVGGGVRCWGTRYLGGSSFDMYAPNVLVPDGIAVATSNYSGCAAHVDRTVSCWGYLFDQTPVPINNTPTSLGLANVLTLQGGWNHYCAITTTGLVCWGDNLQGQLGRGTASAERSPAPVTLTCETMMQ